MSNMSYCRFENTVKDLMDCERNLFEEVEKGGYEDRARARLVKLCHDVANQVTLDEIDDLPTGDDDSDD